MLPFLGNTWLSLAARGARLQCPVSKVYRYCFTAVFGGAGFLLGGVTTSPVSKGLREYEERFVKGLQRLKKWRPGGASGFPLLKRKQVTHLVPQPQHLLCKRLGDIEIILSISNKRIWSERDLIHSFFSPVLKGQACLGGAEQISSWFSVHWWMRGLVQSSQIFDEEDKRLEEKLARLK
ncbi:hypothetical protein HID58_004008, partial [Brassica napus]